MWLSLQRGPAINRELHLSSQTSVVRRITHESCQCLALKSSRYEGLASQECKQRHTPGIHGRDSAPVVLTDPDASSDPPCPSVPACKTRIISTHRCRQIALGHPHHLCPQPQADQPDPDPGWYLLRGPNDRTHCATVISTSLVTSASRRARRFMPLISTTSALHPAEANNCTPSAAGPPMTAPAPWTRCRRAARQTAHRRPGRQTWQGTPPPPPPPAPARAAWAAQPVSGYQSTRSTQSNLSAARVSWQPASSSLTELLGCWPWTCLLKLPCCSCQCWYTSASDVV